MILHSRNLLLKSVLGGLFLASAVPLEAGCHGRSGGGSYGSGHSSHNVYSSHVHSSPVYHHPVYSQPSYPQPVYSQPVYSQSQPVHVSTPPIYSQPQQQPQYGQVQQGLPTQSGYPTQQTYPTSGQPIQNGSMQGNTIQVAQAGSPLNGQGAGSSMMGGQTQVAGQPQLNQQGNVAQGNPMPQNGSMHNVSMQQSGNAGTPQTGAAPLNTSPQQNNAAPVNPTPANAQQSALQALGGFAPPQAAAQSSAMSTTVPGQQNPMAGSWTASLPNGARVQLALQADGNFSWTAINKDGQSSVFQGTYAVENGALSLTRGNDGQKLQGNMTMTESNAFRFKLAADQSAALEFVRG